MVPGAQGAPDRAHGRSREGRRRRLVRDRRGPDARARRRVRLGQVDDRLLRAPAAEADGRLGALHGAGADDDGSRRPARDAQGDADRLPGSVLVAESAHDGRQHRRRADARARPGNAAGARGARARPARDGRLQPGLHEPVPARVLGRPAAAHRHRARARAEPAADRVRRAGVGARRLDPGADPQPAQGSAARPRPRLPLRRARPRRRAHDERQHRRDEQGQARRDRPGGGRVHEPAGGLHEGAARRGAGAGPAPDARAQA